MKLIRFGPIGHEKPGIWVNENQWLDASSLVKDYDREFFEQNHIQKLQNADLSSLPSVPTTTRLGAAVKDPSKIVCIGLNYAKHAKESGMAVPAEPVVFFKSVSAITGPNDPVTIPKNAEKTDWEVELAVVIGKKASYIDEHDALDYVAGYMLHNDYSERAFQLERGGQWVKGKSCDTFAPLGPYVATQDEISDVNNLRLWLSVNGQIKQDGNTNDLIFKIPFLISYLSQFMSLLPGDIISTGTPAGVGLGFSPPQYLRNGDVVRLGIDGLGESEQTLVSYNG